MRCMSSIMSYYLLNYEMVNGIIIEKRRHLFYICDDIIITDYDIIIERLRLIRDYMNYPF